MFNPKHTLSDSVLRGVSSADLLTARLWEASLPAEVLKHIRKQCQVALTHYSTQIEGNALSLEQVSGVLEEKKSYGLLRDEREVANYFRLLSEIPTWIHRHQGRLPEALILQCHRELLAKILDRSMCGKFRSEQNAIYEARSGRLIYIPPEAQEVPALVKELCAWVVTTQTHPIIRAAIFHNQWVTIHPFMDGNGRSARLMSLYLLESLGYEWRHIVPIDRYYADDRARYYAELQHDYPHNYYDGRNHCDFSAWVDYYIEGINLMLQGTLNQIDIYRTEAVLMNNRQVRILQILKESPFVTAAAYARRFRISQRMATRDLTQLVEWGKIVLLGKARASKYVLK